MRKMFFFAVMLFLFMLVFIKSETWETYKTRETRMGVEYTVLRHRLHWDRFFDYIKDAPRMILESGIIKSIRSR
ncbi:MAG: hypothetical protein HQ566_05345 [Candidatus Omnitrophica bacterium]|nr:hypothetical protein [Candidatus Omnitrophota bacterium]